MIQIVQDPWKKRNKKVTSDVSFIVLYDGLSPQVALAPESWIVIFEVVS